MAIIILGTNAIQMTEVNDAIPDPALVADLDENDPARHTYLPISCIKFIAVGAGGLFQLTNEDGYLIAQATVDAGNQVDCSCIIPAGGYKGIILAAAPANGVAVIELS